MRDLNDINIEYADIEELIHEGGKPVESIEDHRAVLLNKYLLISDAESADDVRDYGSLPGFEDLRMICLHNEDAAACLLDDGGFTTRKDCSQWVYTGDEIDLNEIFENCNISDEAAFRSLSSLHADRISGLINEDYKYIEKRIRANAMTGLYVGHTLAGFVGTHEAGSIGMVYVYPRFRGLGLGRLLEAYAVNEQLYNDCIPFLHVVDGNEVSEHLQETLGFTRCESPAIWLFR